MSQDLIVSGDTYEGVERVAATNTKGGLVVYGDGDGEASSPTIAVAPIEGGYRITVTDVAGSRSFDMKNGLSPTINITETPFADANGAGSAIKIACVSKDPVTGEETESSETVYVRNGKNGLHGTDVTLDITRQSGDDPGWWFKKKQTVYNADGTTKVTETTDFIPVSDDFVIAKISGSFRDDTLEWEYTVLLGGLPAPAGGLNALVESGKIVIGVADGDLGFRFFADEAYNDSYVVPSGTVFNYNNGTFWFSNFADKDGEIKNMAFAIKAGYKDSPWWGMTYPSQYTIYLTGDQPGRIVEFFGRKLEPREAYEILLAAANNDIPLLCYQKDAVFRLEDGSTHTPQYGTPFYYDHNTELLHCEHDGYECTLYVDLDDYKATAEKNTPYKTAESKADDLKEEDGTLFLLSAGEPIGEGVPIPTGDSNVFIAVETTTFAEIKAAFDAGKVCFADYNGLKPLLTAITDAEATFTHMLDPHLGFYVVFKDGVSGWSDFGLTESNSVLYDTQSLTDAQKAQARTNIGALSTGDVDTVLQQAKDSGQFDGEDGYTPVKGKDYFDGYTPVKGKDYFDGANGKTAYAYAQDGGYTGTEAEFASKLAETGTGNVFVGNYDTVTFAEIKAAHDARKVCFLDLDGLMLPLLYLSDTEAVFVREVNDTTDYKATVTSAGGKDFTLVDKNTPIYVAQTLSDAQKAQARTNIGAAAAADIAATKYASTSTANTSYFKISDFGSWGTGAWYQKGFSMLITSRAGETVWFSLSANDSATTARAFRLMNTYSKIAGVYYSVSENAVYVKANAWCNNVTAHILSNIGGDYVPTVASVSGLASDAVEVDIIEFGPTSSGLAVGDSSTPLLLGGSATRPTYNGADMALSSDLSGYLPTTGTAAKAAADGNGNNIVSTYFPKSGGKFSGPISFDSASLPSKNLEYICGIDAFANGGQMGWQSKADFLSGCLSTNYVSTGITGGYGSIRLNTNNGGYYGLETAEGDRWMFNGTYCGFYNKYNQWPLILENCSTVDATLHVSKIGTGWGQDKHVEFVNGITAPALNVTGGAYISGRYFGGGDDEGLVIGRANNNYAGLTLGSHTGVRSTFYLMPDNSAVWRYNNGSTSYDIRHPGKAGTIALTDDVIEAANGALKVTLSGTSVDKTLAQIETALNAGRHVYMAENDGQVYQLSMHIAGMIACFTSVVAGSNTQVTVKTVVVYDGIEPSVFTKTL